MEKDYLPVCREDMIRCGWDQVDFAYVVGDAYVDHPSFGHAIISRILEAHGFRIGIIAQPDWKNPESITVFGRPKLGFLVTGGNMDSMVNHYSVSKKRRQTDAYTPGGVIGKRPDYATVVYCNLIRKVYKEIPILIGGIEASLRRLGHYDYWSNRVKRSILLDSQADILMYGMGEHAVVELAEALQSGIPVSEITFINGTVYKTKSLESVYEAERLPSFSEITTNKAAYAKSFYLQYCNTDPFSGKRLVEPYQENLWIQSANGQMFAKQYFKDQEEIRLLQEKSRVEIKKIYILFKIHQQSHLPCRKWMIFMHFHIREITIQCIKRMEAFQQYQK